MKRTVTEHLLEMDDMLRNKRLAQKNIRGMSLCSN
jgi:hypothetical protein